MCPRAPEEGGAKMRVRINNFSLDFDAILTNLSQINL